jgi:hypothetical protein
MIYRNYRQMSLVAVAACLLVSCGKNGSNPLTGDGGILPGGGGDPLALIAKQCGIDIDCTAGGIAKGNASISGVLAIDAFFQSVLDFQAKADNVSASIDAQLTAIRGDFGIAASADLATELKAQVSANIEGSLTVKAEPAKCEVDAQATLEAQAHCDASVNPGSATVKCQGSCDVEADAMVDCGANADLMCTITPPMGMCSGTCKGTCEAKLSGAAKCDGTCKGTCMGNCSAYSDSGATQCAGSCDGMCMGSCEATLMAEAKCDGTCSGECTIKPPDGKCTGAIRAHCDAKANAMVECKGRCDGSIEPPSAKAECNASAKAEAKLNVECTPPRVAIAYKLKAGVNADAQAKFEAGLKNLQVRLPALLAAIGKANAVVDAGKGLTSDGKAAVEGGITAASSAAAKGDLKVIFGLKCAAKELGNVGGAIKGSSDRLAASVKASADLKGALGL